ncbi:putative N-formylglutamate amidohydrolase [Sphingomonas jejuensis]|uniref:N-formylglutamate amidohydrolase n=1 Tax=Sphingomonas jejuensis TaxID=904715 RepID=A0ABX0XMH2_9SPHN|nr:putative N-formylglutamate amidohydrolase [Sphingomonas jejuensis]
MQRVNGRNGCGGGSDILLIGDHGGDAVPAALDLGVSAADMRRHIAVDIGIRSLGEAMADRLDAVFLWQRYSRLVIDCNRAPGAPTSIPPVSDGTAIPGNVGLTEAERDARAAEIHAPYQQAIAAEIAARRAAGRPITLVSLHSFTPEMAGQARPWHVGILHDGREDRVSRAMLATLAARGDLVVGDNEPYRMDVIDYTVPRHAFPAGLPYLELEVRQDLIADAAGVASWCDILSDALGKVC